MSATAAAIAGGIASAGVAAASGIGNTLINYGANKDLQHDARVFNAQEAQKQRDWEQYMSNTAYQRQVADMRAAGINPASLSGATAGGSSTPAGSSASTSAPGFSSNSFGDMNSIINSAIKGVFAKDRQAAELLSREVLDNARHGHRMEEMQEYLDSSYKYKEYLQQQREDARESRKQRDWEFKEYLQQMKEDAHSARFERDMEFKENKFDRQMDYKFDKFARDADLANYRSSLKEHREAHLESYKKKLGHRNYK